MVRNLRRILCILIALVIMLAAPAAVAEWIGAYSSYATNVYQYPYTSSASIAIPKGTPVMITAIQNGWAQVLSQYGVTAYCPLNVLTLANRMKGYITRSTPIYLYATTSSTSAGPLGVNTEVYVIGWDNNFFRVQNANGSITGYVPTSCVGTSPVAVPKTPTIDDYRRQVVVMDWYNGGSSVLKKGEYGTLYDIMSGQFIKVYRMGGSNHADLEPATAADTQTLYNICGGEYSWDSRPVILIAGGKYVACAINTMPHGSQTISNNGFDGQFCLHMINSRTHGSDSVNSSHQEIIQLAYQWCHR